MGAHFRLPIFTFPWDQIEAYLAGVSIYVADAAAGRPYYQMNFTEPIALIIGGEAAGAGTFARDLATGRVQIPMPGAAESLNAAVAGAILIFEVVRQRHRTDPQQEQRL
jgi:TrmH family RNA methyltransferase